MPAGRFPPYQPWRSGPPQFAPRLAPIDAARWLLPDVERAALAGKRTLMRARRDEVHGRSAGMGDAPAQEVLALVVATGADGASRGEAAWPTPLEAAAARVSDDFCLLLPDDDGLWRLREACVCAPTFWRLADVLGQPLGGIHAPVPGGDPGLALRISRVFDGVQPGLVLERFNWTVQPSAERFTPSSAPFAAQAAAISPERAAEVLHLRVERQTVRKLAATGAVVFTIRVSLDPLTSVLEADREGFAAAWRGAGEDVRGYKKWALLDTLVEAALA